MIYLDNAATTFPKPPEVCREVYRCMTEYCGNPGRGGHALSLAAANKVFECRSEAADLLGISDPAHIVFTLNTTHALNFVIKGLVRKGDHIIISDMEHNSVLRPIHKLATEGIIEYSVFSTRVLEERRSPTLICAAIAKKLRKNTRMVVCSHSSNICSATLPLTEIGNFCRRHGILFVVDAAQSAGHIEIDVEKMNIDALCVPSHKALYGPQGAGFAALGENISLDTLIEGGNGINSQEALMPDFPPERYESGTLPTPAIAGLCEGIKHIRKLGVGAIHEYESSLYLHAREQIGNVEGITLYAPEHIGSTLLFSKNGISSEEVARNLNSLGICVRSGFHCSPLAHKTLATPDDGAARISFSIFNTKSQLDLLARALSTMK